MIAAAALYSVHIGGDPMWTDETYSYFYASMSPAEFLDPYADAAHPPTYYLTLHYWMRLFGDCDACMRSLSLVFMVMALPVVYGMGRIIGQHRTGVTAMLVFGSTIHAFRYAQEARTYAMLAFLGALVLFLMLIVRERAPSLPRYAALWAGLAMAGVLAVGVHHASVLFVPGCALAYGLAMYCMPPTNWRQRLLTAGIVIMAGALVWAVVFLPHLQVALTVTPPHQTFPFWTNAFWLMSFYTGGGHMPLSGVLAVVGAGVAVFALARNRDLMWLVFFGSALALPALLYLTGQLVYSDRLAHPKVFIFLVPFISVLVAYGISKSGKWSRWLLTSLLVCNAVGIALQVTSTNEPWDQAAAIIDEHRTGDSVVVCQRCNQAIDLYLGDDGRGSGGSARTVGNIHSPDFDKSASNYNEVWTLHTAPNCNPSPYALDSWGDAEMVACLPWGQIRLYHLLWPPPQWALIVHRYVIGPQ